MRRLLLLTIMFFAIAVPVFAHSGKTDLSGGHYDHDTGDYHYHHGYSAHDHYDMDGDGDSDCPYDFDDQTNRNSGTASSTYSPFSTSSRVDDNAYDRGHRAGYDEGYEDGRTNGLNFAEEKYDTGYENGLSEGYDKGYAEGTAVWDERLVFAGGMIPGLALAVYVWVRKNREIKEAEQHHLSINRTRRKTYEADLAEKDAAIAALQKKLVASAEGYRTQLASLSRALPASRGQIQQAVEQTEIDIFMQKHDPRGVSGLNLPEDIQISEGVLYSGARSKERPYGDLTVYTVGFGGKVYHTRKGCSNASLVENVYDVAGKLRPCARCALRPDAPTSKPDWYKTFERLKAGYYSRTHVTIDEIRTFARDHDVGEATALKMMNEARKHSDLTPFYYEGPRLWD